MQKVIEFIKENKKIVIIICILLVVVFSIVKLNKKKRISENIAKENEQLRIEEEARNNSQYNSDMLENNIEEDIGTSEDDIKMFN